MDDYIKRETAKMRAIKPVEDDDIADAIVAELNKIPSADVVERKRWTWIPCNKCDVPKYKHFLGTDKDGRIYECYWAERNDYKGIYISHVGYAFDSIIAWMPLPEAYKERSE